jgi:hypothetical protein
MLFYRCNVCNPLAQNKRQGPKNKHQMNSNIEIPTTAANLPLLVIRAW